MGADIVEAMRCIHRVFDSADDSSNYRRSHEGLIARTSAGTYESVFDNGIATLHIDNDGVYRIESEAGDVLYRGVGYDDAIGRLHVTQRLATVEIIEDGTPITQRDYERKHKIHDYMPKSNEKYVAEVKRWNNGITNTKKQRGL